jgi:hypothetical protein
LEIWRRERERERERAFPIPIKHATSKQIHRKKPTQMRNAQIFLIFISFPSHSYSQPNTEEKKNAKGEHKKSPQNLTHTALQIFQL